jgi:predicted glycosyltransferase involved in capsule biosynthesis
MRVSFGTSCMGRSNDIKRTYLQNIRTCESFGLNYQFTLLNWNSSDDLDFWVNENLSPYIDKGLVNYLVNTDATEFSQSKTKNTTLKNSSGDIVCTLDADNLINDKFLEELVSSFSCGENKILQCEGGPMAGRIAFLKKSFLKIRGFDESMHGWGWEDRDFVLRFTKFFNTQLKTLSKHCCGRAFFQAEEDRTPHGQRMNEMKRNRNISNANIKQGNFVVNPEEWGMHFNYEK